MKNRTNDLTQRNAALVAGIGYLIIFILAIFSNFFVLNNLIISEDAAATVNGILASEGIFRIGIISFVIVAILDVVVAMALYILFKPIYRSLSLLAAWFRLMHAIIFGVAIANLILVVNILNGDPNLTTSVTNEMQIRVMIFLDSFNIGWLIGLVFFGIHLSILGYLIIKSDFIPKILGYLLIAAALGYLVDSFAHFLLADYSNYKAIFLIIVALPGIVGEMSFCLWLLFKGTKISEINLEN
ncbi:MAG: DUF4386 domain-containing protein [Ignavibacteriaceae bacterium]|jgi:hypothetical protein|nr:DUF4386 domain-containing protein [Chlorobium sp.]MCW8817685.1 DUF4386 domain-containing protein [Ignavibacteriaceae bacterium]MCW8824558.1 DUF4386 domain-containing protein [Ignavibacteriaceae bacterium]